MLPGADADVEIGPSAIDIPMEQVEEGVSPRLACFLQEGSCRGAWKVTRIYETHQENNLCIINT